MVWERSGSGESEGGCGSGDDGVSCIPTRDDGAFVICFDEAGVCTILQHFSRLHRRGLLCFRGCVNAFVVVPYLKVSQSEAQRLTPRRPIRREARPFPHRAAPLCGDDIGYTTTSQGPR